MHEQSVINDLIKKIISLAEKEKAEQVTRVSVRLGALSHMSAHHFKEHFDIAAKGTIAENAEIDTEESQDMDDPNAQVVILRSFDVQ